MKRIQLTVAYDGTAYHGWQFQPGQPTIEGELNRQLSALLGKEIMVIGASRTDTGVHSLCNIAVFDTDSTIPPERFSYALNQRLPEDIRVRSSKEVEPDFHPRKVACRKTYEYRIVNEPFENPLERRYSYFVYTPLNMENMRRAAAYLVGEHDFSAFCAAGSTAKSTIRIIYHLELVKEESLIRIRITGNGFLYNMVRIIAGTLIEVGKGRKKPEEMERILEEGKRILAGPTAPATGLILVNYEFT
ncbi:MAG: tRNA pseudouridine(38-40) synthase TruA [Lachnospiraceae bacterium]